MGTSLTSGFRSTQQNQQKKRKNVVEWPKTGIGIIPDGFTLIIGYNTRFLLVTETTPGRYLIGRNPKLPDAGHVYARYTRLWLFNPRRVPDSRSPYPKKATYTGFSTNRHHTHVSGSSYATCYRRRRQEQSLPPVVLPLLQTKSKSEHAATVLLCVVVRTDHERQ